jgi:hypothetical protein
MSFDDIKTLYINSGIESLAESSSSQVERSSVKGTQVEVLHFLPALIFISVKKAGLSDHCCLARFTNKSHCYGRSIPAS